MKNILSFIYDGFVDYEISLACTELNIAEAYQIVYIAYEKTPVKSSAGLIINPDNTVADALSLSNVEGLIIPGGRIRILKPELERLIRNLHEKNKLIAAICGGPEYLAKVGLLNDRKFATSMYPDDYMENQDPFPRDSYVDARVVKDGNIITAKGDAFADFALEIWDWFGLYDYDGEKAECKTAFTPL